MSKQNNHSDGMGIVFSSLEEGLTLSVKKLILNTAEEAFIVNDQVVKLWLIEHWKYVERKRLWIAPFSILLSVAFTLSTFSVKDTTLGIPGIMWFGIFIAAAFGVSIWLIIEFLWFLIMKYYKKVLSIDKMVNKLKKQSIPIKANAEPQTDWDFIVEAYKQK